MVATKKLKDERREQFDEYAYKLAKIDLDTLFEKMEIEGVYSFKKLVPTIKRLALLLKNLEKRSFDNLSDNAVGTLTGHAVLLVGRIEDIQKFLQGVYHRNPQEDFNSIIRLVDRLDKDVVERTMPQLQYLNLETNGFNGNKIKKGSDFWSLIHPKIAKVSKEKFEDGHFADAVESAFKDVNKRVKKYVKSKHSIELDGADLMYSAFSLKKPLIKLDDLSTETGRSIQQGYMEIFAGSMTGIRNPKAHDNLQIKENKAIHFLFLASLLMYKLDEIKVPR